MQAITVVTRSFQTGTGGVGKKFNAEFFKEKVAKPIRKLLRFQETVKRIVVVTNGDLRSNLAENLIGKNITPTVAALRETFPEEVACKRIITMVCLDWGKNPGSGNALNMGLEFTQKDDYVMMWSPEIYIDGYLIAKTMDFMEQRKLLVAGLLRENWWEKTQWNMAQNTAAIWNVAALKSVDGFAPECNGTGSTVNTEEFGEVLLAGMEDFHAMLRIMKINPDFRWGMVGRENPLEWDTNFEPGSERGRNHLIKVARQAIVMAEYAKMIFPELSFSATMNRLFSRYHQE